MSNRALAILTVLFHIVSFNTFAYDACQDGLCYNIISEAQHWVNVVSVDSLSLGNNVSIPATIIIDSQSYEVVEIADNAFSGCVGLRSLSLPSTIREVGVKSFFGCSSLSSFYGDLASYDGKCLIVNNQLVAFAQYGLEEYEIPKMVTSLGSWVFSSCENLLTVVLPDSLTEIGGYTFYSCGSLEELVFPESLTTIGVYAFTGCSALRKIVIPDRVQMVGEGAFQGCNNLRSATISKSLNTLEYNVFCNCSCLTEVHCRSKVPPSASITCFDGVFLQRVLYVPIGTRYLYAESDVWKDFYSIIEEDIETPEPKKCSLPTICYEEGKLLFDCDTEDAKFHYTLTDSDVQMNEVALDYGVVSLSACYDITVYATANGYMASDTVRAQLFWVNAELEPSSLPNQRIMGVIAACQNGKLIISGIPDDSVVKFYDANGLFLGESYAVNRVIEWDVPNDVTLLIANVGSNVLKIMVK